MAWWDSPLTGGIVSGGLGLLGSLFGGDDEQEIDYDALMNYKQLPDYPEVEQSRAGWWKYLQEAQNQPDYGSVVTTRDQELPLDILGGSPITPEWEDIWERIENKVNQFYWGGATTPGLADKLRASAARRGVSESPAMETELLKMGAEQGGQLKDLAVEQGTKEANLLEQERLRKIEASKYINAMKESERLRQITAKENARLNWLSGMQAFSGQKPAYMTMQGAIPSQSQPTNLIGDLGSSLGNIFAQKSQMDWYSNLLKSMQPQTPTSDYSSSLYNKMFSQQPGIGSGAYQNQTQYGLLQNNPFQSYGAASPKGMDSSWFNMFAS